VPEDLNDIGNHQEDWGKIFILINDVNLAQYTDAQFRIIGNSPRTFTGILDGSDHKVCNFTWSSTDRDAIGLFAFVGPGGQIRKLGMENTSIHAGTGNAVGALVGRNYGGKISNCCSTGSISADEYVGGLVGYNEGTLSDCYSTAVAYGQSQVGGLVGDGLAMRVVSSFWDIETSGKLTSPGGGKGRTTVQMKTRLTFTSAGWDFVGETANGTEDIWTIKQLVDYPKLVWQMVSFVGQYDVDFADYSFLAGHWLNSNCAASNDCNGTDLNFSGSVDATDLAIFCQH